MNRPRLSLALLQPKPPQQSCQDPEEVLKLLPLPKSPLLPVTRCYTCCPGQVIPPPPGAGSCPGSYRPLQQVSNYHLPPRLMLYRAPELFPISLRLPWKLTHLCHLGLQVGCGELEEQQELSTGGISPPLPSRSWHSGHWIQRGCTSWKKIRMEKPVWSITRT